MKLLVIGCTLVVWGITTFLVYRVARFRASHRGDGYFGTPPSSVLELLSAQNYTAEGHHLLPYLWVALSVLVVCAGAIVVVVL